MMRGKADRCVMLVIAWVQVGPESVGASEGFLGWVAYLGAANAGIPLSIIVKNYGWEVRPPLITMML